MNNQNIALPFNPLRYANRLKSVGVPDKQAEVQAEELNEMININLVTKRDLQDVEINLKQEISRIRNETRIFGSLILAGLTIVGILVSIHH